MLGASQAALLGTERLGPNLVVNGGFDNSSSWAIYLGSISGGVGRITGVNGSIGQSVTLKNGSIYKYTITVTAITVGVLKVYFGDVTWVGSSLFSTPGTYTGYITNNGANTTFYIGTINASCNGEFDNVTLQEVLL